MIKFKEDKIYGIPEWESSQGKIWRNKISKAFDEVLMPLANEKEPLDYKSIIKELFEHGVSGIRFNQDCLEPRYALAMQGIFSEELGNISCGSIGMALTIHLDMVCPLLFKYGDSYELKDLLNRAIRGELLFSHAVSEVGAGSDVSAVDTTANMIDNYWVLNGTKTMICLAKDADYHFVLARLPDKSPPFNMVILMVSKDLEGVSVSEPLETLGNKKCPVSNINFNSVKVPDEFRVGPVGMGFLLQMRQFIEERIIASLRINQSSYKIFSETLKHCQSRIILDKHLIISSSVQFELADIETKIEISQSLCYNSFNKWLNSEKIDTFSASTKLISSKLAREIGQLALQKFGWRSFINEHPASVFYRDSRLFSISTGSDEMMLKSIVSSEKFTQNQRSINNV